MKFVSMLAYLLFKVYSFILFVCRFSDTFYFTQQIYDFSLSLYRKGKKMFGFFGSSRITTGLPLDYDRIAAEIHALDSVDHREMLKSLKKIALSLAVSRKCCTFALSLANKQGWL